MFEDNKEKYIEKIQRLLQLSRRSTNEHEATYAISQAQNLMRKFGLKAIDIDLRDIHEYHCAHAPSNVQKLPVYMVRLANLLCRTFGVDCYHHLRSVAFYGPHERLQVAAYGFDVLTTQLVKAQEAFIAAQNRRVKRNTKTHRADQLFEGWVNGAWFAISVFCVEEAERSVDDPGVDSVEGSTTIPHSAI
ncbi:hypothetical protein BFS14_15350 [Serratia fonticola]|uniref:DUF2786 domain-containing protein n=1 Tax=Serratia fonticola TaxID=47917 RepID=UPI0008FD5A5A|nr:DUF2786 domain-containing protein [Serratia fonticola]OIX95229.1 hypothetical protein BFS14_15350 [Serratia fonticola]QCR62982.1 DUF2786 domain-containing protein [Serratia fonticola]